MVGLALAWALQDIAKVNVANSEGEANMTKKEKRLSDLHSSDNKGQSTNLNDVWKLDIKSQ